MTEQYRKERLSLLNLLIKDSGAFAEGQPWTLVPDTIRFRHGEGLADLKVPYHLGVEDEEVIEKAVSSIAGYIKKRAESQDGAGSAGSAASEFGAMPSAFSMPSGFSSETVRQLKDRCYRIDVLLPDSLERQIAARILQTTPHIDGSILTLWLGSDGEGKKFISWIQKIFEKALKEETSNEKSEKTAYLVLLAVMNAVRKKKGILKEMRIKGLTYEKMDVSVGLAVCNLIAGTLRALFDGLEKNMAHYYSADLEMRMMAAVEPQAFVAIASSLLASSFNPAGINAETFHAIERFVPRGANMPEEKETLIEMICADVRADGEACAAARSQHMISGLRERLLDYLIEFDAYANPMHKFIYDIVNDDRLIKGMLSDADSTEKFLSLVREIKEKFSKDAKRLDAIEGIDRFVSAFGEQKKSGWFGGGKKGKAEDELDAVLPVVGGFLACWLDGHVDRFVSSMRHYLLDRRENFDSGKLLEEYNKGRLYRFSVDGRSMIVQAETGMEGQLFIDMKGFTRRTIKVKEVVMAEFMRENFYEPILDAAVRCSTGLSDEEHGIRLNSLPGDAAVFSGNPMRLVKLAGAVQTIIAGYREKLIRRLPPQKEGLLLDGINKRFEDRKQALKERRTAVEKLVKEGRPGAKEALLAIAEEDKRVENTYRDELETAINMELEAGLFISYGAKAETITLDTPGVKASRVGTVAIGEKINEASRGTFRNSVVRAKMEMLLERERIKRNNHNLKYPFDVYVDRIYTFSVPPDMDVHIDALVARHSTADIRDVARRISDACYADLEGLVKGAPISTLRVMSSVVDIYNKGQAMSAEALEAYMEAAKMTTFFFTKTVSLSELHNNIKSEFFLPFEKLEICFGHEIKGSTDFPEAFVRIGEVVFKGFEALKPTVVYEIINKDCEFFKKIMNYHYKGWLDEARAVSKK